MHKLHESHRSHLSFFTLKSKLSSSASANKIFACSREKEDQEGLETYTFYVAAGRVEHRAAACDYIDWTTTGRFQQNLGTI